MKIGSLGSHLFFVVMIGVNSDLFFCGVVIGISKRPVPQGHHHSGPGQLSEIRSIGLNLRPFYGHALLYLLCKAGIKADV